MKELPIDGLITDLALILVLGAVAIVLFKKIKQPVVLGYIVAGFLASPHFSLLPSVANEANIEFWAQIGIIVLLFSLGLEFSFKKLLNAGGSAVTTVAIIIAGMMGTGFVVGKSMGFTAVNSIFLGSMLSTSSTTIIIKALSDLNMRQRRFVPHVLAALIVEDLFAVVLMVVLSSIAINKTVAGGEMLWSVLKLLFFLIIWFLVGVFMLPSTLTRFRRIISNEMLLIIAMGLCFMMAIFSVKSGFSMALGAFVMGSILAGTSDAERIERVTAPVKDLFGAVFFISVGMMVDPVIIVKYWPMIALLSVVVIVGMIIFGTFGMLATGKPLKIAMESGFCLTQIGEFSFIIATLGMTLHVLDANIYPIIVSVSVITTFTTPFFIKSAVPCYNFVERHMPKKLNALLEGYSTAESESGAAATRKLWATVAKRYLLRLVLYTVVVVALIVLLRRYVVDVMIDLFDDHMSAAFAKHLTVLASLAIISPFLYAILTPRIRRAERQELAARHGRVSLVPQFVMMIAGLLIGMLLIMSLLFGYYSSRASVMLAVAAILFMVVVLSPVLRKRLMSIEQHFISNVNQRENRRTGRNNNLVSDMHLAYMIVGYDCPFVGEKLKRADLRKKYGVNVASIQRNSVTHFVPTGDMRIFPGDVLGVIGTEEQIQALLPLVEASSPAAAAQSEVNFTHFELADSSPLIGKTLADAGLREDYAALLVALRRGEDYVALTPDMAFMPGDMLWLVGDKEKIKLLQE